jgi:hypothetical protein
VEKQEHVTTENGRKRGRKGHWETEGKKNKMKCDKYLERDDKRTKKRSKTKSRKLKE